MSRVPALCVLVGLALAAAAFPAAAPAALDDLGFEGPSGAGAGLSPTGDKPESKLWWSDGFWWASMWDTSGGGFHIFRLNVATQSWVDTEVALDARANTRADVLWDPAARKLYVASHVFGAGAATSRLYRFSYNGSTNTYSPNPGFPATINGVASETLVIAKDSTGQLWATWTQGKQVWVNRTLCSPGCNDASWGTPFVLSMSAVTADDISSVIAFGSRVGVMWSDQADWKFSFAVHANGAADTAWETAETALFGTSLVDDHINLKADGSGRVFAAVKTDSDPLVRLLVRAPSAAWTSHTFGRNQDHHTRPIVLLDEVNGVVHVIATSPETGSPGAIYEKTSPLGSISFAEGLGTPILRASDTKLNDVSSTKQNLNGLTDLVVVAYNPATNRYWHAWEPIAGGAPPSLPPPPATNCTVRGTPGDDVLVGTPGHDVICGFGGNDRLLGRGGNDDLRGGAGRDRVTGGQGRDVFRGGAGADTLFARDSRRDVVDGGPGRDRARVDRALDRLRSIAALF